MLKLFKAATLSIIIGIITFPAFAVTLTSVTMEKCTSTGEWTNAPGGIWSTNTGDSLTQLAILQNGAFLNKEQSELDLGEVSIPLSPGINTFELYGTSVYNDSDYYGLALFFDGQTTPPAIAVYNSNLSTESFSVIPGGTTISGSANGGLFPDTAPGTSVFSTSDGAIVRLIEFKVSHADSNTDIVSWGNIAADGYADTYAILKLHYTSAPTIVEFSIPTADSNPVDLVVDPYGNLWFTERNGNKIGQCSPSGSIKEYAVSCDQPFGIAYDQYSNSVYFAGRNHDNNHGRYGILNIAKGTVNEFPTGLTSEAVDGKFTPDRKFWFNGWSSRTLSRADNEGNITHYLLPSFGYTSGLSEDPEGNFWLTKVGSYESNPTLIKFDPQLAQPETSNGFTELPLPYSKGTIRCPIAALGKIWLPIMDQSKIISYDPDSGSIEEYNTPTPNAVPQGLAFDKWNRLWFAENAANKIGMLDLRTGVISEFSLPNPDSSPTKVAVDMSRDIIWFIESSGNKIGKLTWSPNQNQYEGDLDNDGDVDGDDLSVFSTQFGR